jgi:predicted RNA binding protein YcfA (HicA-like mRNA interferase family)
VKAVSGRQMCKVLERQGWSLIRVRGSHHIYGKAGARSIPVPVHGNRILKSGTQRGIMNQAGLTEADL